MPQHVVIDLSLAVEVTDPETLAEAAVTRYLATKPDNTPPRHVEEFTELLRTDPGYAVHQFLENAGEAVARGIPGVRYVGQTYTQRALGPAERAPWA